MYKYAEIVNKIEYMIEIGEFKQGEKLLSIRQMTDLFDCNKSTILRALEELKRKHIIYSVPKSGYYIIPKNNISSNSNRKVIDFASSAPDSNVFPYLDFQHCINQAIDKYRQELFLYGTAKGLPSLISTMKKQLMSYQVFTKNKNIFIISGVQQAISILLSLYFPNQKNTILVEQPSYHLIIEQLQTLNIPVIGITRDYNGIDFNKLERIFKEGNIKFFYIMPRYHNPLGTSLTKNDKKTIIKLAYKYNVYIVEDDFLSDYETNSKSDPIYSYDYDKTHVIYLKSFSKIMFPGLRVGVAVIPDILTKQFNKYKIYSDIDTSMISQAALEIYIKSGMFDKHKEKMKTSYFKRAKELNNSIKKYYDINNINSNYSLSNTLCIHRCLEYDKKININRLKINSISISDISQNYLDDYKFKKNYLKLNVSNVSLSDIEKGIRKITELI